MGDVGASSLGSYPLMVLVIAFLKTKGYKVQIPNFCWAPTAEHGPEAGVTPMADQPLNLAQVAIDCCRWICSIDFSTQAVSLTHPERPAVLASSCLSCDLCAGTHVYITARDTPFVQPASS